MADPARAYLDPETAALLRALAQAGMPGTAAVDRHTLAEALGTEVPPAETATLGDRLGALASWFGNALPGRGGVGPPGRYPRGSQGLDIAKEGGRAKGTFRFQGAEAQPFDVGAEAGAIPVPKLEPSLRVSADEAFDNREWYVNQILPIIRDFAKHAPEGSAFKAITDWNAMRSLSRATQDTAAAKAVSQFLDWIGNMPEARRQGGRWLSASPRRSGGYEDKVFIAPAPAEVPRVPWVLDPKTGRMRPQP